ncbi:MAG: hypothetical protein OEQ53_05030 [Saprospiraceae bacterium]|nr:hypothetical protein [Saprospiraceae bacterium]
MDKRKLIPVKCWTFLLAVILVSTGHVRGQGELTVIGNGKSVPSALNMEDLGAILKGETQRWNDGKKIVIALMKTNTPIGSDTCLRVYNMSGNELNKHFLALVFQGRGDAPTFFTSVRDLEEFVSNTPGAIGILDNVSDPSTRVIMVDGKKAI